MATKPRAKKSSIESTAATEPLEATTQPETITSPAKTTKPKTAKATAAKAKTAKPKATAKAPARARKSAAESAPNPQTEQPTKQSIPTEAPADASSPESSAALTSPDDANQPAEPAKIAKPAKTKVAGLAAPKRSKKTPAAKAPAPKAPAATAERLQKILAKTGVASRRKGEAMILAGRVQVNGTIVTELGTRADLTRDHIRVDGKLLHSTERIRYFVLNKPKGYVTTVSDPEGRPTVMQFFDREPERLYPVGRLDYLSEGLLLVTNDGELANKLTRAASGVEKVYLVKVAGQPTEEMLDTLRAGVVIERGRPGTSSGRVRTAPAEIRSVRQGDNPWFEVVLIEGRNRELRKMFEEIGHHIEKIRRVGYGPLILDQEPGKMRELDPEELRLLRLAADGKLKPKKRRAPSVGLLPREAGRSVRHSAAPVGKAIRPTEAKFDARPAGKPTGKAFNKPTADAGTRDFARPAFPKPAFTKPEFARPEFARPEPRSGDRGRPARDNSSTSSAPRFAARPTADSRRPAKFSAPARRQSPQPPVTDYVLPPRKNRPDQDFEPETARPPKRGPESPSFDSDPKNVRLKIEQVENRPSGNDRPRGGARPSFDRGARPSPANRGGFDRRPQQNFASRSQPARNSAPPPNLHPSPAPSPAEDSGSQPRTIRAYPGGPRLDRPQTNRSQSDRPGQFRPGARPSSVSDRPARPSRTGSSFSARPPRAAGPPRFDRPDRDQNRSQDRSQSRDRKFDRPSPQGFRGDRPARPANRSASRPTSRPAGARPYGRQADAPKPQPGGSNSVPRVRLDPDGQPRIKVRARNSFTGKNKGKPKR